MLVAIWARVLGIERVGVHDDFFELGGHSLLVTQVVSRVHQTFQVDLPVHTLFGVPTVAGLAEIIEHKRTESETVEMRRILEKVRALSEEEASKELRMRREDKTWEEVPCPNKHAEQ
jgi:surfactin family lipopeptide synthetase C